jgi:predicted N-formylglutamate amidohydrolase
MTLLNADEPVAVTVERPKGASELVFTCDHASWRIPAALGTLGLNEAELKSHIAWDIGAASVAVQVSAILDATLVLQNYSRLVIDCNRPPGSPTSIPIQSEYAQIAGNHGIDAAAKSARVHEIFDPYHAALRAVLDERRDQRRSTLLVAVHSFTPVYLGKPRPWKVGLMFRKDQRLGQALLELLRRNADLNAGENEPYAISDSSDYTLPIHGEGRKLAHVGIEMRQDLIMDSAGQNEWATRLAELLPMAAGKVVLD